MTHDCDAAAVAITYNGALSEEDEAEALAFIRSAVDTQHAKAGGSFELRVQWIIEPKPRTLRDEARAVVPEQWQADAVLAAVKASLDALPMTPVRLGEDHLIAGQFTQTTKRDDIDALFGGTS